MRLLVEVTQLQKDSQPLRRPLRMVVVIEYEEDVNEPQPMVREDSQIAYENWAAKLTYCKCFPHIATQCASKLHEVCLRSLRRVRRGAWLASQLFDPVNSLL
ncbi:hypothetical protein PMIT1327_00696 [Prochlorococcus marinus str. MIT 1327]|nr:hypothetical protein PMIT1312_00584 [Prochlorococcus marinus str. MIT 1312]KZR82721.1 hypothetical protein PMIT1327_00696 [Prochlorococcus marinus str. MIT 1327]